MALRDVCAVFGAHQAKAEPRIAGFTPWHFNNRSSPQHGPPCDMELGAVAMPDVVAKLKEIGEYIVGAQL